MVKCSEVLLGEVQMGRSEVSTSVVKWIKGLSDRVSIIIRKKYIYRVFHDLRTLLQQVIS